MSDRTRPLYKKVEKMKPWESEKNYKSTKRKLGYLAKFDVFSYVSRYLFERETITLDDIEEIEETYSMPNFPNGMVFKEYWMQYIDRFYEAFETQKDEYLKLFYGEEEEIEVLRKKFERTRRIQKPINIIFAIFMILITILFSIYLYK